MSTRWADKRLVGRGERQLLWTDAAPADRSGVDEPLVLDEQPDLLGVAGAWCALAFCALYLLVVIARYVWSVIAG